MAIGLAFMTFGTASLMAFTYARAIFAISCNGLGIALATPTTNLLVARIPADCRASSLNLLNFFWSAGAMACPFLVAAFQGKHQVQAFLLITAVSIGVLMLALIAVPMRYP